MIKVGEIKLSKSPEETITTVIEDTVYNLRQLWNTIGFWTIDILTKDGIPLVTGIKIISGLFILKQYANIPFDLKINSTVDPSRFDIEDHILEVYIK